MMIKCVCLVVESNDKLLLVQARHRKKYYFPGGKIDPGESMVQALKREINEELQLDIPAYTFRYLGTVIGDAYPQKDTKTELNCFSTTLDIEWSSIKPAQEITALKWFDKNESEQIAPAVITWIAFSKQKDLSSEVILTAYDSSLHDDVANLNITKDDRKFTKTPLENIELAMHDKERHPTLVYNVEKQCIGFFTLHGGKGVAPYTENPKAIFFRSFSIDYKYRGMGYGKQVIQALPQYVMQNYPDINEIYLTVNTDNTKARTLYMQCRYQYIGDDLLEGRPVNILKKKLSN